VVGGTLRVASANLLNYFTDLDTGATITIPNSNDVNFQPRGANTAAEFTRQRDKTIQSLLTLNADVIGIQEMENDGVKSLQDLVNGLNTIAGAGTYAFVNDANLVNDPNSAANGVGTDAIKVGILYKPGKVSPVGLPQSSNDPIFSRPPVAQTFVDTNGGKFTVIMNHFKSKSASGATGLDADQNDGQGAYNAKRVAQSEALLTFINTVKATSGDDDVLVIGDLNAYAKENPITTLTNGGLTNLFAPSSYSYQFNGQWGSLDHALASGSLASQVTGAEKFHNNSDEPIVFDYNTEFKSAGQLSSFYSADPYRASDHDPIVLGFNLTPTFNTILGTGRRDTLVGTAGADQITGGVGADRLTGGAGADQFIYTDIRDAGDTITDFAIGSDKLVLTQLLDSLVPAGYTGNAIADGYVRIVTATSGAMVQVDRNGTAAGETFRDFITVQGVTVAGLNNPNNFIF
jgi:uncharacterized protein